MKEVTVFPEHFTQFGDAEGVNFFLLTNNDLRKNFKISSTKYASSNILPLDSTEELNDILQTKINGPAHILVIAPNSYIKSPDPALLGKDRKLCVMACNSTPFDLPAIQHFLECAKNTDANLMDQYGDNLFDALESQEQITFFDERYNTRATFNHVSDKLQWHQQCGTIDWGHQQLFPSGEISTLPVSIYDMNIASNFELNGDILLQGHPILHSGSGSYLPTDQQRIFDKLKTLEEYPLIARVQHGVITELKDPSDDGKASTAQQMFDALFALDSRYRAIIEIGFGLNHWIDLYPGNSAMNEVYAKSNSGTLHWGLGLTPYTQYHLDLISPYTSVLGDNDKIIFGHGKQS